MIRSLPIVAIVVLVLRPHAEATAPDARTMLLTCTVRIVAEKPQDAMSIGSGVVVARAANGQQTYVLTAAHTLADARTIVVEAFSLDQYPFPAQRFFGPSVRMVATNPEADLALLALESDTTVLQSLPLCPLDKSPTPPFAALACGCSCGEPQPLLWTAAVESAGTVLREGKHQKAWLTAGRDPFKGESGGPLVSSAGTLVGICLLGGANQGVYCHLEDIHRFLSTALPHTPSDKADRPLRSPTSSIPASKEKSDAFLRDLFGSQGQ